MNSCFPPLALDASTPFAPLCRGGISQAAGRFRYAGGQIRLHSVHLAFNPQGVEFRPHRHGFFEGICFLHGRGCETASAGERLQPGTYTLQPPDTLHGWKALTPVWRLGVWFEVVPPVPVRQTRTRVDKTVMTSEISAVFKEAQTRRPGRRERLTARLLIMLTPFLECLAWPDEPAPAHACESVATNTARLVDHFLKDNLAQPISLGDVAQQMNMSMPTLSRHFRRETGESVMQRLHAMRMRRAIRYLQDGGYSVKEIAVRVGIPEPSYFCRCFRRHFGVSPMRWRQFQTSQS